MKKLFTTFRNLLLGGAVVLSTFTYAQFTSFTPTGSYTFPQTVSYAGGRTPSFNIADAQQAYEGWKSDFVTSSGACGQQRVIWDYFNGGRGETDRSSTVSEGVAYGMLLAAYAGDKGLFDDLWDYYKQHRNGNGVMHWQIRNCGIVGQNGASDAELDVAMALIVASHQWQSDAYLNDAKNMIRIVREKEFDGDILKPGDAFGGNSLTNPSYFSPAYYRVFATLEPSHASFWNNAVTKGYQIIDAAGGSNGVVPDWCNGAGNKVNGQNIDGININATYEDGGQNFIYDGIRTPFRSAIDYLWHGSTEGRAYCTKFIDWAYDAHSGTTWGLGSKYSTNGSKLNSDHSNTFVGCFSMAAMAAGNGTHSENQYISFLQSGYDDSKATQPGYGQYFNATFKALSFFVMTGHFYLPPPDACSSPDAGNDISLCQANTTLTAGISAAQYTWKKDGNIIGTSSSINAATNGAGIYEIVTTQADGCTRRDAVEVFEGTISADFVGVASAGGISIENTSIGGISTYSWTVSQGGSTVATSSDVSPVFTGLTEGIYDVKLDVDNAGFGCGGSDSKTKQVAVGLGAGVAMDDFNDLFNNGVNLYTYGPAASNFDAFPTTYCSRQDELDGLPQNCADHRCSYVDLKCNGATANWASMEFEFFGDGPFDLSTGAFVSVKMSASSPVTVDVRLGTPDGASTFLATAQKAALTTTEQVFTFDFTNVLTGDVDGTPKTITAWDAVNKLTFRPYGTTLNYTGTISIDYVIVGAKALAPPTFNVKKDAFGYTDFGNYLPDFYPNDPALASCTPSTVGSLCYGSVPDWTREVLACGGTAVVDANACLATEVRWYNGNTLVHTGDQATLAPGFYYVDLIGPGGVTRDSVTVVSADLTADFTIDRDNLQANFINNSTDFDSFSWDYGDPANDEPGSATFDIGYHNYTTAGAATYTVELTVNNTTCGTTEKVSKQITVACDQPGIFDYTVSQTAGLCGGDDIDITILNNQFANSFGYFGPLDATTVVAPDELSANMTFANEVADLTIQGYNMCGLVTEEVVVLDLTPAPSSDFTPTQNPLDDAVFTFAPLAQGGTYTWDFGDATPTSSDEFPSHTYTANGPFSVCLDMSNSCGTAPQVCKNVNPIVVGLANLDAQGNISVYPTATSNILRVELPGTSNVVISDVLGNTMSATEINNTGSVDVSELTSGMYILTITQGDESVTKRFVKQ